MFSNRDKANIVNDLEDAIEKCLEAQVGEISLPYRSDNVNRLMAEAAFAVLEAVSSTQDYLSDEGLFFEDDDN